MDYPIPVDYPIPETDWEQTIEELRKLTDKADTLACDLEDTLDHYDKNHPMHDTLEGVVENLMTVVQICTRMGDKVNLKLLTYPGTRKKEV